VATQRKTGRQAGTFAALRMLLPVLAQNILHTAHVNSYEQRHSVTP
jgi:hypothetical protein